MFFNSTFILGLTLTTSVANSPLISNSNSLYSREIHFQNLNLKKFYFHALYFKSFLSNLSIHKSYFEQFLEKPISIQQVDCSILNGETFTTFQTAPCATITYCTFRRIDSGAFYVKSDNDLTSLFDHCIFEFCSSESNGGALSFDVRTSSSLLGSLAVTSCTFNSCKVNNNNNNPEICGGAIYFRGKSLNLANTTFSETGIISNQGSCYGGAIYAYAKEAEKAFYYNKFENCYLCNQEFQLNSPSIASNSYGGAIYLRIEDYDKTVELFACSFKQCFAMNGTALFSENRIKLVINATKFLNDIQTEKANSVIYLSNDNSIFINSLGISNLKYTYFIFCSGQLSFLNGIHDSGHIHLKYDDEIDPTTFTNSDSFVTWHFNRENYDSLPEYTYQTIPATPSPITPTQNPITPTQQQPQTITTPPQQITSSSNNQENTPTTPPPTSSVDNAAAAAGSTKKGLSTVAIIFIVLACLIFVIGVIIATVLLLRSRDGCYRNKCLGSDTYLGNRATSNTYF